MANTTYFSAWETENVLRNMAEQKRLLRLCQTAFNKTPTATNHHNLTFRMGMYQSAYQMAQETKEAQRTAERQIK